MRSFVVIVFFAILSSFTLTRDDNEIYPVVEHETFTRGEQLEYKLNFGIFTVGRAKYVLREGVYKINERPSYKVDVYGRTTGFVGWVANVDDHWWAYVDSASLLPHISARRIREGGYRRDEVVRFNHETGVIENKVLDQRTQEFKPPQYYTTPIDQIRDMLGGVLYFRTLPLQEAQKGDTITVDSFFEDTFYNFRIIIAGRETIKTGLGKFKAIKMYPVMPENEVFDGESSIYVWFTDDKNLIPLKGEAKMFIGHAGFEIASFKGLRNQISSYVP